MLHSDQHLTEQIRLAGQSTLPIWIFLTSYGIWVYVGIGAILVFLRAALLIDIVLPVVLTHVLTLVLQQIIGRERPPLSQSKIVMWKRTPSFPSAHSASATACAIAISTSAALFGALGIVIGIFCVLLALGIGFSRIIVGVHYFSDVIFGFIFGIVVTGIVMMFI